MPSQDLVGLTQLPVLAFQRLGYAAHRVSRQRRNAARPPASTSAFFSHSCSVCAVQPILAEIETTAAQRDGVISPRDPAPSAPRVRAPRAKTCSSSCLSWLHLLRSWSLRQTRGGSFQAIMATLSRIGLPLDAAGRLVFAAILIAFIQPMQMIFGAIFLPKIYDYYF
jgi:hypothetical protein